MVLTRIKRKVQFEHGRDKTHALYFNSATNVAKTADRCIPTLITEITPLFSRRHVSLVQEAQSALSSKPDKALHAPATATTDTTPPRFQSGQLHMGLESFGTGLRVGRLGGSFPDLPGPSPSPPPLPIPAPAPANVSHRWDRGVSASPEARQSSRGSGSGLATKMDGIGTDVRGQRQGGDNLTSDANQAVGGAAVGRHKRDGKENDGSGLGRIESESGHREGVEELQRLVEWRNELLETGMYTVQNPIVSELSRRIASARATASRGAGRPLQREE